MAIQKPHSRVSTLIGELIMNNETVSMRNGDIKSPWVTIIACVFNVEHYISLFIESLFSQTYSNIGFVFVNDGTEDRSIVILEDYLNTRYCSFRNRVTIVNKQNEGLPLARTEGLGRIRGDYFIFLDPDDWIEPDMIERMVRKAESSSADLVYCDYYLEYSDRTVARREARFGDSADSVAYVKALYNVKEFHSYLVIKLFRSTILNDLNLFVPPEGMMEDMVFSTQFIAACSRIEKVEAPLYHYNKANPSAMTRMDWKERRRQKGANLFGLYRHLVETDEEVLPGLRNTLLFWIGWCMLCANGPSFFLKHPQLSYELFHCHFEDRCDTRFYPLKRILLRLVSSPALLLSPKVRGR